MRSLIIITSVILATSAFPQYAPALREGSNGPVSHSPPKNAVRATRVPKKVLATRDPNYVSKKVLAVQDPNYIPRKVLETLVHKKVLATRDPNNYVLKKVLATRDPNYIKKAEPSCDCSKIRQEIQTVQFNTANLAPAQQEGKQSAPETTEECC